MPVVGDVEGAVQAGLEGSFLLYIDLPLLGQIATNSTHSPPNIFSSSKAQLPSKL